LTVVARASELKARSSLQPLPFRLASGTDIVVPVVIEGRGPFEFLLDTGSSRSAISIEVARLLRRSATGLTRRVTATGEDLRPTVSIDQLDIGVAHATNLEVMVLERLVGGNRRIEGLVGQDVLRSLTYTIDYEGKRVIWRASDEVITGTRLPLELEDGRFVAVLAQDPSSRAPLRLVPDTGADGIVLFTKNGSLNIAARPLDPAMLRTLHTQRVAWRALLHDLRIGDVRLRNEIAVLVDGGSSSRLGDGLLPLHLFSAVTFNGPERYLVVGGLRASRP
jgi:predicted aspartyl protease